MTSALATPQERGHVPEFVVEIVREYLDAKAAVEAASLPPVRDKATMNSAADRYGSAFNALVLLTSTGEQAAPTPRTKQEVTVAEWYAREAPLQKECAYLLVGPTWKRIADVSVLIGPIGPGTKYHLWDERSEEIGYGVDGSFRLYIEPEHYDILKAQQGGAK